MVTVRLSLIFKSYTKVYVKCTDQCFGKLKKVSRLNKITFLSSVII